MANILRNIPIAEVLSLSDTVTYAEGQVVSKTLVQNEGVGITLFAFAKGEGISTHESKGDALVVVLDGKGRLTIDGKDYVFLKKSDVPISDMKEVPVSEQNKFKF